MSENTKDEPVEELVEAASINKAPSLLRNYISFGGFAIVAASLTSIVLLILIELTGGADNPYTDLITFIFVPSILVFGLFVVLAGALLEQHERRHQPASDVAPYPILDFETTAAAVIPCFYRSRVPFPVHPPAFGSYRAFEYTESVTFWPGVPCRDEARICRVSGVAAFTDQMRRMPCRRRSRSVREGEVRRHPPALRCRDRTFS